MIGAWDKNDEANWYVCPFCKQFKTPWWASDARTSHIETLHQDEQNSNQAWRSATATPSEEKPLSVLTQAESIAKEFHRRYETLAPLFSYETRKDSAVPWDDVPEKNKNLMIAVVESLLESNTIQPGGAA